MMTEKEMLHNDFTVFMQELKKAKIPAVHVRQFFLDPGADEEYCTYIVTVKPEGEDPETLERLGEICSLDFCYDENILADRESKPISTKDAVLYYGGLVEEADV